MIYGQMRYGSESAPEVKAVEESKKVTFSKDYGDDVLDGEDDGDILKNEDSFRGDEEWNGSQRHWWENFFKRVFGATPGTTY